jgi:hypothetical protein
MFIICIGQSLVIGVCNIDSNLYVVYYIVIGKTVVLIL